jgi:exopolysaccharide production protein ExoY
MGLSSCQNQRRDTGQIMGASSLPAHSPQGKIAPESQDAMALRKKSTRGNRRLGIGSKLPAVERCASIVSLIVLAPALACVLFIVRVLSGRSPLVAHRRAGLNGKLFWVLKIRTMWNRRQSRGASSSRWIEYLENAELPVVKNGRDPRVTSSFAAFCRRFSIDEIPQLIHVASGKMRLIGPRPLTRIELETYYGDAAREVLSVPPGITGLWQVMGRNRLTYAQRRRLDMFYVQRFSLKLYWFVLGRTPWCVLRGRDVF